MDPKPPAGASKLRLMCSSGGHIVPRPHDKSLFYAGGETRIVAVDRRTTAGSFAQFTAHLSRAIFHNRPFQLKYQLPNEDLDSLISVVTDEDLVNMLEEHDRISFFPERIRLFLFPVKPEGISLMDAKSETWFCDALKSTGIGSGGEERSGGGGGAESLVLETSLSFNSTTSSASMSNSPPIGGVQCEENGLSLMERKIRVTSSASIESDNSVGSSTTPPSKPENFQEPLIQVDTEALSTFSDPSSHNPTASNIHLLGYPLSHPLDSTNLQNEPSYTQHYVPQYNQMPVPPYYQTYQMPLHQHQPISCPPNQPYPIYLVPIRPSHFHNMPMQGNFIDSDITGFPSRPPLPPPVIKEVFEPEILSESVQNITAASPVETSDFEEDIVYNQIYKTQPLPPVISSKYTTVTNHAIV